MFTVAIIGRPNVGKSTLFNRLVGKRHAIVDDRPGVTRDRREGFAIVAGSKFKVIDTAGLENAKKDSLEERMMQQTKIAVDESNLLLFVVDGRAGIVEEDRFFAKWIRKQNKPVLLLVNKCEGSKGQQGYFEALNLGFSETLMVSAEHNEGMSDLYQEILSHEDVYNKTDNAKYIDDLTIDLDSRNDKALQFTIIGRPNTGKSTFINKILGKDRVLVGPEAGITRDSIAIELNYKGCDIKLIDTAGIRRKANITEKLEQLSVDDSLRALTFAHVAVLMIDATIPLEKQDLSIAEIVINEGRALVIALNKWDLIENKKETLEEIEHQVNRHLSLVVGVPVITISALKGQNVKNILDACLDAYEMWNKRFSTSKMNEWLKQAEQKNIPPLSSNKRRIRLKYITQGNTRPPTFTLFVNYPQDLPDSYRRYLINDLRTTFDLKGVPIRMMLRKSENPYANKNKAKRR